MRPNNHSVVGLNLCVIFIVDTCFAFLLWKAALALAFIERIEYRTQSLLIRREHAREETA